MEVPSIFLNKILSEGVKKGASSLHLSVGSLPMLRVSNALEIIEGEDIVNTELISGLINSFIEDEEVQYLQEHKEIVLVKELFGDMRFRVNIFYQKDLPSLSFYFIPGIIKPLKDLNLPDIFNDMLKLEPGLFIVAGSYSSGKTSTIASFLEEVNKSQNKYIVTLERPIEYQFVSKKSVISQRNVGRDVDNFKEALQYCLNEDVNLIYISDPQKELNECLPEIVDLASGNSLVLLELNVSSAVGAVEKVYSSLVSAKSEESARYGLADVLKGVVVQKLLPKIGGGMILASEVLIANSAVKSLIREGKIFQIDSIIQTSRGEGMINMDKAIGELVKAGLIKG